MTNRPFGSTVRDFSKTTVAREFLKTKFKFEAIVCPNLAPLKADENIPPNLLGATFDYLLLLLIERRNPHFDFVNSFSKKFKDGRSKLGRALNDYVKTEILNDVLIDELISYGEAHQKSFQKTHRRSKLVISDSLRSELKTMHQLAIKFDWNIQKSFHQGWLKGGHFMTAIPDLILDGELLEVKSVKDAKRHDEYLSQLFSYFILTPSSRPQQSTCIDEMGIYYARHGMLTKNKISQIVNFPLAHLKRVAFDFEVEFQYWRDGVHPLQLDPQIPAKEIEPRRWMAFNEALAGVYPKPDWLEKALENRFKRTKHGVTPQQIKIAANFLIA
jgi:hypothetical protein